LPSKRWLPGSIEARAQDAVDAIGRIKSYVRGFERRDYFSDQKTQAAVERELEKISEACIKIRALEQEAGTSDKRSLERRFPDVPWAQIRGIGNRLRHDYGRIDAGIIWDTIAESRNLDDLRDALQSAFTIT
jgi:uncharacterized protein with HEPN domain